MVVKVITSTIKLLFEIGENVASVNERIFRCHSKSRLYYGNG